MIDLLKKHDFDSVLPLLSAMKETWPSDAVFVAPAAANDSNDDSSMSTDEDSSCLVSNLLHFLQNIFLGEQLFLSCTVYILFACLQPAVVSSSLPLCSLFYCASLVSVLLYFACGLVILLWILC